MTPLESSLYTYYVGWVLALLLVLGLVRVGARQSQKHSAPSNSPQSPEFRRFQTNYLIVYLIMMAADWLQGPYVYALYSHYGYSIDEIGQLFVFGFGSSLIFGTIVGSMSDKYGRKLLCMCFAVFYIASCLTKHFNHFYILLIGRLLGGISTSILFSSFESWMVHEHQHRGYSEELLSLTFSKCTAGNGIVAILSGVVASLVRDRWGPVAPFDCSIVCLCVGLVVVAFTWTENTGDSQIDMTQTLTAAFSRLKSDQKMVYLGIIQSFFEGAMYVFVFMWTPALTSTSDQPIYHGWIFAAFMVCVLIGSRVFEATIVGLGMKVEKLALSMFIVSATALIIPSFANQHTVRMATFCVFEVCVGMFWPIMGTMRSRYVPEEVRATVMNIFRIPLNLIVSIILLNIGSLTQIQVFMLCFVCLLPSIFCQWRLCQIVDKHIHVDEHSSNEQDKLMKPYLASKLEEL